MEYRDKSPVTIVDIARQLDLSPMTVSRALNGSTDVSEQTKQRVLQRAEEMGYRANRWARSLVTNRSSIVGLVIPDLAHSFFAEITSGIEEVLEVAGYDLLLCHSRSSPQKELAELDMLMGTRVAGLIVASVQSEDEPGLIRKLAESSVPLVLIDRFFPGIETGPVVRVDDVQVGRLATEHLLDLGHTAIACIAGPRLSPATLRRQGYVESLQSRGIAVRDEWIICGDFQIEGGRRAMQQLLNMPSPPSGIFAANDPMAIGAVYACREAGLRVPADVSIVGAGNIEGPHHPNPFLTTVDWPRVDLGRIAGRLLVSAIRREAPEEPVLEVLPPMLLQRDSTGRRDSVSLAESVSSTGGTRLRH